MSSASSPDHQDPQFGSIDLDATFAEVERSVLDLEPKVRDLNRHLVALLGRCPASESGNWAYLARNEDGEFRVAFEMLPFDKVLQIASHVARIVEVIEQEGHVSSVGQSHGVDLGPGVVGDAAGLMFIPTTHVRVERPS